MSKSKLSQVSINSLSVFPSEDDPSLAELLMGIAEASSREEQQLPVVSTKKNAAAAGSKSRKQRRSRTNQARSRRRAKRTTDDSFRRASEMRKRVKQKKKDKKNARNRGRVEEYQTQSGRVNGGNADTVNRGPQTSGKALDKSRSIELSSWSRPAILGLFDYLPWYDEVGDLTTAGNVSLMNTSAKTVNLRDLIVKNTDASISGPAGYGAPMTIYYHFVAEFLESLDIASNGQDEALKDALDYLSLDEDSAKEASATEVVTTILRDFCSVLHGISPKLLEADTRKFAPGHKLPPNPSEAAFLGNYALAQESDFMQFYESTFTQFDSEQICKIILNSISNEMKLSINKNRVGEESTIDAILNMSPARATMMPGRRGIGPLGDESGNGLTGKDSSTGNLVFPFEPAEIVPSRTSVSYKIDSALDVLRSAVSLRAQTFSEQVSSSEELSQNDALTASEPYAIVKERYFDASARIAALLDYSWCSDESISGDVQNAYCFSEFVFRSCLLPLKNVLHDEGSSLTKANAVQLYFLCLAATDVDVLKALILYLAALRDYVPVEEVASPVGQARFSSPQRTSLVELGSGTSDIGFSEAPFSSPWSAASTATSTISAPSVPAVETATSTYGSTMKTATTRVGGRLSGATSRSYTSSIIGGAQRTSSTSSRSSSRSTSVATFINRNIGDDDTGAEEYVDAAFSEQASMIASFLYGKISAASSGEASSASDPISYDIDEDTLIELLSEEPLQNNIMSGLLSAWDALSEVSIEQSGISSGSSTDLTSYSEFPIVNLETAFFIAAAKLCHSIFYTSWTSTDNGVDTSEISLVLDTSVSDNVSQLISLLWQPSQFEESGFMGLNRYFEAVLESSEYLQQVSMIQEAVSDEEHTSYAMATLFNTYFENIANNWAYLMKSVIQFSTQLKGQTVTLSNYITSAGEDGTASHSAPMSSDAATYLLSIGNEGGMTAGLHASSPSGISKEVLVDGDSGDGTQTIGEFVWTRIENIDRDEKYTRVLAVALPNGLLDSLQYDPVSLGELNRTSHKINKDVYELTLEKIDVTRPDKEYEPKKFYFPRKAVPRYFDTTAGWTEGAENAYALTTCFRELDGDSTSTWTASLHEADAQNNASSGGYGTQSPENMAKSEALKLYVEQMYGVSLRLSDFPSSKEAQDYVMSSAIPVPAMSEVDTSSTTFLSASNLAFMSEEVREKWPNSLKWWNSESLEIDVGPSGQFFPTDSEEYSLLKFINSYGSIPSSDYYDSLNEGLIFEDIVCIGFDHRDWEVKSDSASSESLDNAEAEVGVGLETSEGLDFGQYRVTIRIPEYDEIEMSESG